MKADLMEHFFPMEYVNNYLVLLVRDPYCLFVYWELSPKQREIIAREFKCTWGEVPLLMRVNNVTGINYNGSNAQSYVDIPVHPLANNWYLKELAANSSYCIDLGVMNPEGRFITVLRSNIVSTPRDSLADGNGLEWADLLDKSELTRVETFSSYNLFANRNKKGLEEDNSWLKDT